MTYDIPLTLVDLCGLVLAIFILGMMAGHRWLPRPIDVDKERLIDLLFNENIALKMQLGLPFDPDKKS